MRSNLPVLAAGLLVSCILITSKAAIAAPPFQGAWYYTCPLDSIMGPVDVAVASTGDVLVCQRVFRAERFTGTGGCVSHWYVSRDPSQLIGIDEMPGGGAVVLDHDARKIRTFDANGLPVNAWGAFGAGAGQLENPVAIALAQSGNLLVVDYDRGRVLGFSLSGLFLQEWTPTLRPGELAVDDSGYVYLANPLTGEVAMYHEDGVFIRNLGSPGTTPGHLKNPSGIAVSPDGLVHIADSGVNMISIFTRAGVFVERFGGPGVGPGEFNGLGDLAFDQLGNLYVVDENNYRICKFGPGPSPSTRRTWGQLKVMHR